MKHTKLMLAGAFALTFAGLGIGQYKLGQQAVAAGVITAPTFEVDPYWPKPLPNHWVLGNVIGIAVDARDHVYIVHRVATITPQELGMKDGQECCQAAPPVIEFDPAGNVVRAWGGPGEGFTWPTSNHGLEVDSKGNVWIGGNGGSYGRDGVGGEPLDSHILKFTGDGKFLQQIGEPLKNTDSNSTTHFGKVAEIAIDEKLGDVYVADGYGNKRVVVLDFATGAFKKYWGAYGNKPDDKDPTRYRPGEPLPKQFTGPVHCAQPSNDGLLYVCDRTSDRIQVFKRDGTYVTEVQVAPKTGAQGSTWDVAFSTDKEQKYMYLVDGQNMRVYVMDRKKLEVIYSFGGGGRQPGTWFAPHSIAADSKGNLYTTETYEGKRVQKFNYKGINTIKETDQGPAWPKGKT